MAHRVGDLLGIGGAALTAWEIVKWPTLVLLFGLLLSILYYAAPNVVHPGFRWVTPGGLLAIVIWIAASAAFAFYVATFSSYDKTYGSLGGMIVFLIWLWVSNIAILLGAEFDAELARERAITSGTRPDRNRSCPYGTTRRTPAGVVRKATKGSHEENLLASDWISASARTMLDSRPVVVLQSRPPPYSCPCMVAAVHRSSPYETSIRRRRKRGAGAHLITGGTSSGCWFLVAG